jgi:indolepyruvate ferredoxin oxidoreductase, beta subunit
VKVLSEVCLMAGLDVKKNEIHGMSQRGGSVVSHVRFGEKVYSSIIPEGEADILFSFELLETCRYLAQLRKQGRVVVNDWKIAPPSVALGKQAYPENLVETIGQFALSQWLTASTWRWKPATRKPSIPFCWAPVQYPRF